MRDERLSDAFTRAYGRPCDAEWLAAKDFQVRWRKTASGCTFWVSDYLSDAPDGVLREFAEGTVAGIGRRTAEYGQEYMAWMTAPEFAVAHRPVFLRRSRNLARTSVGNRDLTDSVQRLLDAGLIVPSDIDASYITWTSRPNYRRFGYCSPLMRTVAISCALDSADVPEEVLDYVVYHECLHLRQGYRPFRRSHDVQFRRQESLYPGRDAAESALRAIADGKR